MASPYDPDILAAEPEPDPRTSLVRVRIGAKSYDAVYSRSCRTCTHPARALIEEKVLLNYSYPAIAEMFSGREVQANDGQLVTLPDVPWSSIRHHYRSKHMPLEFAAARRIVDARAEALGEEMESSVERIVEARDVTQMILDRGHDLLAKNAMEVTAKDTLAAAKLLTEIDERVGATDADGEAWGQAMQIYFETARRIMPPDLWRQFTQAISKNPVLRALEARDDPDTIDAEYYEER